MATAKRTPAVSVYYPFALIELLDVAETDEHEETGEMLLSFFDAGGCQVTLRLTPDALEALRERLNEVKK